MEKSELLSCEQFRPSTHRMKGFQLNFTPTNSPELRRRLGKKKSWKYLVLAPSKSMPNMTGRLGCRTMEMNGGSSASYLARNPCIPLFCALFTMRCKMVTDRLKLISELVFGVTDTDFNFLGINYGVTDTDLALLIP